MRGGSQGTAGGRSQPQPHRYNPTSQVHLNTQPLPHRYLSIPIPYPTGTSQYPTPTPHLNTQPERYISIPNPSLTGATQHQTPTSVSAFVEVGACSLCTCQPEATRSSLIIPCPRKLVGNQKKTKQFVLSRISNFSTSTTVPNVSTKGYSSWDFYICSGFGFYSKLCIVIVVGVTAASRIGRGSVEYKL